ncbi:hypothetical protein K466DRAFT_605102 [Polyporus arcularius HHB13444]|uniref:F-box domain-containing protein n=1 Tax=Polyporus arcularius HHB13444 TaxID=1314778 RepID=A0A5C3NW14_9APHY|nr:hypothetical protein K466DRAFT_605102 [Polyporus arcularius HHB13444]
MQLRVFLKPLAAFSSSLEEMTIVVRKKRMLPAFFQTAFPLFGGRAPRLKSLSISSPDPLFPSDIFPELLALHLSGFTHGSIIRSLAQLLRNAQSLETVHVHPRYPMGTTDNVLGVFSAGAPIHLPRMRRFCLTSLPGHLPWHRQGPHGPSLYTLLSQIIVPPSAVVTLQQTASYAMAIKVPRLYMPPSVGRMPVSVLTADERGTTVTTRGHSTYSITYQERLTACAIWGLHEVPPRQRPSLNRARV